MGLSRQEYWSGLPFPSTGDLPDTGIELASPVWQADSLPLHHPVYVIATDLDEIYMCLADLECIWRIEIGFTNALNM